ncbi:MAG: hypothetical protein LUE61_02990 [Clostridiales bacterium]|nr:hypothetical protein [Clostridiales bacterium]
MTLTQQETKVLLSALTTLSETLALAGYDLRAGDVDETGSCLIDAGEKVGELEVLLSQAWQREKQ